MTNIFENEAEMLFDHQYEQALKDNVEFDAEQERRRLYWVKQDAERAAANAARVVRELPARKAIVAAVEAPHAASLNEETGEIVIDGVTVGYALDFKEERTQISSWRSRPNGKTRITVGGYGDRRSFPQRKDGTHNYEEIASALVAYAVRKNAQATAQNVTEQNKELAKELCVELNVNDYWGTMQIKPSAQVVGKVAVKVDFHKTMSPAKARELHATLKALGVL